MGLWKKFIVGVAVGFGSVGSVDAQSPTPELPPIATPDIVLPGLPASTPVTELPAPIPPQSPTPPKPTQLPESVTHDNDAFSDPIFSTPTSGELPPGSAAVFNPAITPHTEQFVFGPPATPPGWKLWGGAEVLLGTTRRVRVPPVVTTGPATDGILNAGRLGEQNTMPLFGGRRMLNDFRGGLRAELGLWFDDQEITGFSGRFYSLYSTSEQLVGGGNGTNVVNLPQLLSVGNTTVQIPVFVGFPGLTTGTVTTTAQTMFAGGDLNLRRSVHQTSWWRLEALVGYRQLFLRDELGAEFEAIGNQVFPILSPAFSGGDNLRTRNHFFGGNLGVTGSLTWNRFTLEGLAAVALGVNVSELDFNRNRSVAILAIPPVPLTSLEVRDNMTYFGTAWENGVKVGFRVTDHAKLTFGYTWMAWWNVRRAPEQFTLGPSLTGETTRFDTHLFSWGAEFHF